MVYNQPSNGLALGLEKSHNYKQMSSRKSHHFIAGVHRAVAKSRNPGKMTATMMTIMRLRDPAEVNAKQINTQAEVRLREAIDMAVAGRNGAAVKEEAVRNMAAARAIIQDIAINAAAINTIATSHRNQVAATATPKVVAAAVNTINRRELAIAMRKVRAISTTMSDLRVAITNAAAEKEAIATKKEPEVHRGAEVNTINTIARHVTNPIATIERAPIVADTMRTIVTIMAILLRIKIKTLQPKVNHPVAVTSTQIIKHRLHRLRKKVDSVITRKSARHDIKKLIRTHIGKAKTMGMMQKRNRRKRERRNQRKRGAAMRRDGRERRKNERGEKN